MSSFTVLASIEDEAIAVLASIEDEFIHSVGNNRG